MLRIRWRDGRAHHDSCDWRESYASEAIEAVLVRLATQCSEVDKFERWRRARREDEVAVGTTGHGWLRRRGLATNEPKPMNPVGLVDGAVLFGTGMALSGYCPGTAATAAGSGRRERAWAMAGMLAAATTLVATYPRLKKTARSRDARACEPFRRHAPTPGTTCAGHRGASRRKGAAFNRHRASDVRDSESRPGNHARATAARP
jgi:hypothetical protein